MECSICGKNPAIIIADGVSISFPRHKVINLKPPTVSDKTIACVKLPAKSIKQTCFVGNKKHRVAFQKALEMGNVRESKEILKQLMDDYKVLCPLKLS
jgi:hypothetical protein